MLAIIQTRLGSERFPRKALADIGGKPMIRHVVDRVTACAAVTQVVVATPMGDVGPMQVYGRLLPNQGWNGIPVNVLGPRVDPNDVLARFAYVADRCPDLDPILRVTGDCPLWSAEMALETLAVYRMTPDCEYAWNICDGYRDGEDVEIFSRSALLRAQEEATSEEDREHVTPWIRRNYEVATYRVRGEKRSKISVDTREDLARVRAIYERR